MMYERFLRDRLEKTLCYAMVNTFKIIKNAYTYQKMILKVTLVSGGWKKLFLMKITSC